MGKVDGRCKGHKPSERARRLRDKISCRYLQVSKKSSTFVENLGKCGF